jgi:hypothetical protein
MITSRNVNCVIAEIATNNYKIDRIVLVHIPMAELPSIIP